MNLIVSKGNMNNACLTTQNLSILYSTKAV